ncbi:MAG: alpha-L-fucosidase [Phycisphaeraceae bacterium]
MQEHLRLRLQTRQEDPGQTVLTPADLPADRLAVVVVDLWTQHYCKGATDWPALMIPGWNQFLDAGRALGIQVVFASAGDDLKRWEGKPQRNGITSLPHVPLPSSNGFLADHGMFGPWPSGCMCPIKRRDPATGQPIIDCRRQDLMQNQDPRILVRNGDLFIAAGHYHPPDLPSAIASWGQPAQQELWNLCQARGITHLLYIGDATNMCVICREFGMIQMRRLGLISILVRDLTNAMTYHGYDPDKDELNPELTPAYGTCKAVEYVERVIGPSIDSQDLLTPASAIAGSGVRRRNNRLPLGEFSGGKVSTFVEPVAVPEYQYASDAAYEAFDDLKYGVRLHWGLYTLLEMDASWKLLCMSNRQRQDYQQLYRQFNPRHFDADAWMRFFADNGMRMFAMTTKHHDGFSLYDTKTRVKQRVNWMAPAGPSIEDCDLAYSVMDSPCKRDIIKELCDAARRKNIAIDLYYSHPDWYDADFRSYGYAPMLTTEGEQLFIPGEWQRIPEFQRAATKDEPAQVLGPNHTPQQRARMLKRHRDQLKELLTNYGPIQMVCLDLWMAGDLWPYMRQTMIQLRHIQPDVMFRARGIGNYGDYFTNEGFIPEHRQDTNMPSFVTYSLAWGSAYDPVAEHYHDAKWLLDALIDTVAKGGNLMVCIGPDRDGLFHPKAIKALEEVGAWLRVNGEAIYTTRARDGSLWKEGNEVRFTRAKDRRYVYAICLKWPGQQLILSTVRPRDGSTIRMLGSDSPLPWRNIDGGVAIDLPAALQGPHEGPGAYAWAFKIEVGDDANEC